MQRGECADYICRVKLNVECCPSCKLICNIIIKYTDYTSLAHMMSTLVSISLSTYDVVNRSKFGLMYDNTRCKTVVNYNGVATSVIVTPLHFTTVLQRTIL